MLGVGGGCSWCKYGWRGGGEAGGGEGQPRRQYFSASDRLYKLYHNNWEEEFSPTHLQQLNIFLGDFTNGDLHIVQQKGFNPHICSS